MISDCHLAGFRARIQARADPPQRDMPDDHLPDPDDTADFELPDQQTLIDAFTAGLSKESQHDFRSLSALLATLPDPSLSHGHVEAIPVALSFRRPSVSTVPCISGFSQYGWGRGVNSNDVSNNAVHKLLVPKAAVV